MGKKLAYTPKSKVRAALRSLFLRSREHQKCLKDNNSTCSVCGKKKSVAKGKEVAVHVHHLFEIDWTRIFDAIYDNLLCSPDKMTILCKECHDSHHKKDKH